MRERPRTFVRIPRHAIKIAQGALCVHLMKIPERADDACEHFTNGLKWPGTGLSQRLPAQEEMDCGN